MGKKILFFTTILLLIIAFVCTAGYFDFDLWARLIAGMGVIEGHHVLKSDFLSYTPTHTWWDHEWGSGVIFYLVLKAFGGYGLIALQILLMFLIIFFIYKVVKLNEKSCENNIIFYFLTLVALLSTLATPIRCHMFSFLLFTVFIYLLEIVRKGNNKPLYLIPILVIFWNNVHGGVVSGIGLLLMYALGEFLNKKPFKKYLITFVLSSLVLFINPWGAEYIKFLLSANTMQRKFIVEWWPIFSKFHLFKHLEFKLFMFLMLGIFSINTFKNIKLDGIRNWWVKTDKVKLIVLFVTLYLALSHVKLMPFFTISAGCFLYNDFCELIKIKKDKLLYVMLIFISIFTLISKDISLPVGFNRYPIKEVEFLEVNNIKGKVLANFGFGSYISYKLYPNNLIYMDGRYEEVYPDYLILGLKEFFLAGQNWKQMLEYFPPDIMILEKSYPIFNEIKKLDNWELVYDSDNFGLFLPKNYSNKKFIIPSDNAEHYKNNLFNTHIKF